MERNCKWIAAAMVGSLWLVYAAGYAWSVGVPDTARDVFMAYRIRHGLEYPLEGPVLGIPHAVHFGPVWFYLLAAGLWIRDSWLALVLFEGFFCGLKFPLAYHCGGKLLGPRFGMLWAAALLLPNWSSLEPLVPFNPNAIGAACFAVLALALRCAEVSSKWWHVVLLGLAIGFAIHVHPTTFPVALLALAAYRWRRTGREIVATTVLLAGGAAALFVPYLVSQALSGWPDWQGARHYMSSQIGLGAIARLPELISGEVFWGPRIAAQYVAGWGESASLAIGAFVSILAALPFALVRLERHREVRGLLWTFAASGIALSAWVLLLRPGTPFYFTYVVMPALAGVIALGVHMAIRLSRPAPFAFGAALVALALGIGITAGAGMKSEAGGGEMHARVLDVKEGGAHAPFVDVWFPARHRQALGEMLCAGETVTSLHGVLAYVEDRSVGLDALFACGRIDNLVLGGAKAGRHWVGLTKRDWQTLGMAPDRWLGPVGIARVEPVALSPAVAIADGRRYFPREVSSAAAVKSNSSFPARADEAIVVSNFLWGYERLDRVSVTADGVPTTPSASSPVSSVYRVDAARRASVTWHLAMESTAPVADVVIVRFAITLPQ